MRTSVSAAGRRASLVTVAVLTTLTTACGTKDLDAMASAPGAPASAEAGQAGRPAESARVPADALATRSGPASLPPVTPPAASTAGDATEAEAAPTEEAPVEPAEEEAPVEAAEEESPVESDDAAPSPAPRAPSGGAEGDEPAAAAAPVAAGTTTDGSGGSFTDQPRSAFTAANGLTGQFLRYAGGIDPARPVGLIVYADGTGEYGVDNPSSSYALGGSSGLVAVGRARNMITLAVESPNQSCECWHTGDTAGYADFLADLIETQLGEYPIREIWLTGFSSGAQEVTRFLVPRHPELLRLGGGWVVFGGGGPPAGDGSAVTTARMAGVRGHWFTGTSDTAVPLTASWGAKAGEQWYRARGVTTTHAWPTGVGHALEGRLGQTVAQVLDGS